MSEVPAIISAEDPVTVLSLRRAAKKKKREETRTVRVYVFMLDVSLVMAHGV